MLLRVKLNLSQTSQLSVVVEQKFFNLNCWTKPSQTYHLLLPIMINVIQLTDWSHYPLSGAYCNNLASNSLLFFPMSLNFQFCIMYKERGLERRKSLHRKVRTSKVSLIWSQRQKSKRSERRKYFQNVKNHFVEKNVKSKQMVDFQRSEIFWRHR